MLVELTCLRKIASSARYASRPKWSSLLFLLLATALGCGGQEQPDPTLWITERGGFCYCDYDEHTSVRLDCTEVTDCELKHLEGMAANLTFLDLTATQISDNGLEQLAHSTTLASLDLTETQVTDIGLKHLQRLACLRLLFTRDTAVTDKGVEQLTSALPDCHVVRGDPREGVIAEPLPRRLFRRRGHNYILRDLTRGCYGRS